MILNRDNSVQLGASGIAFMMILLTSLAETRVGKVPLTFVIQVVVWVYKEAVDCLFASDSISHSAHLVGALVGSVAGYELHGARVHKRVAPALQSWYRRAKAGAR
jgi:membrane associated rhomboid family serine protease